jgi:hypothetical protein
MKIILKSKINLIREVLNFVPIQTICRPSPILTQSKLFNSTNNHVSFSKIFLKEILLHCSESHEDITPVIVTCGTLIIRTKGYALLIISCISADMNPGLYRNLFPSGTNYKF